MKETARDRIARACAPALLATELGQAIGVPAGSMWYPGFAVGIKRDLAEGYTIEEIRADRRMGLGIEE